MNVKVNRKVLRTCKLHAHRSGLTVRLEATDARADYPSVCWSRDPRPTYRPAEGSLFSFSFRLSFHVFMKSPVEPVGIQISDTHAKSSPSGSTVHGPDPEFDFQS